MPMQLKVDGLESLITRKGDRCSEQDHWVEYEKIWTVSILLFDAVYENNCQNTSKSIEKIAATGAE